MAGIITSCGFSLPSPVAPPVGIATLPIALYTPSPTIRLDETSTPDFTQIIRAQKSQTAVYLATSIAKVINTVNAKHTLLALTPTATPTMVPTDTPTLDYAQYANRWSVYRNDEYGFTFEYPALYDSEPYKRCNPATSLLMGDYGVIIDRTRALNINDYLEKTFKLSDPFELVSRKTVTVGSVEGVELQYRSRYASDENGTIYYKDYMDTYIQRSDTVFDFYYTPPVQGHPACDTSNREYAHMLNTFVFITTDNQ